MKSDTQQMGEFRQLYKDYGCVWGKEPDEWLKAFAYSVERKEKVLEIGVGEGRDAIWMAEQGFEAEGIDNAKAGIEKVQKMAQKRKMKIGLSCISAQEFDYGKERCQLVYSFWTFNFMPRQDFIAILPKIKASIKPKGCFLAGMFTVMDNQKCPKKKGYLKGHLFGLNQLLKDFIDFRILRYKEGVYNDPGHPQIFDPISMRLQ